MRVAVPLLGVARRRQGVVGPWFPPEAQDSDSPASGRRRAGSTLSSEWPPLPCLYSSRACEHLWRAGTMG